MGGHLLRCTACGIQTPLYNSCGDRHCPKCQAGDRAAWLAARQQELLPVEYHHVVLTVPHELAPVAAAHPVVFYNLLFRARCARRCWKSPPHRGTWARASAV
jgi:hypothetical protein